MADINTVSISGELTSNVEMSKAKGVQVARFYIEVDQTSDQIPRSVFKVVAFADNAKSAKELSKGDEVVLTGALTAREKGGKQEVEIRARNLIRLPKDRHDVENWEVKDIHEDSEDEQEDLDIEE